MKKLIATTLVLASMATAVAGCNTGGRSGQKNVFGPGSTGNIGAGGVPGGGGGGVPGTPGQFTAGAAMNQERMQHSAVTLPDGRVLVTGGADNQVIHETSELFDPTTNTWIESATFTNIPDDGLMKTAAGVTTARQLHTATLLPGISKVLVVGGLGVERLVNGQPVLEALKTCYIFDPVGGQGGTGKNKYTQVADLPTAPNDTTRFWHNATLLADGKTVLVAGGFGPTGATNTTAAAYDSQTGVWTTVGAGGSDKHAWGVMLTTPPGSPQGITILHGGGDGNYTNNSVAGFPNARTQKFANGAFTTGPQNTVGDTIQQAGNAISTGKAFFAGGLVLVGNALDLTDKTEVFDQAGNGTWTAGPLLNTPRYAAEITEIGTSSDQIVISGMGPGGVPTAECEIWGAFSNAMLGTVQMSQGRVDHKVVTLRSGQVMVIGGQEPATQPNTPPTIFDSTEVYTR